ncbi:MAG: DUF2271 domain-containing protein [Synergistaceae bacterium]|jgi:hypothetical protein|nr:DUF2271 domain-containing protein [Synergistaceae bacterium]
MRRAFFSVFFLFFLVVICIFLAASALVASDEVTGVLEVSFRFERQSGPGSNQFAVWVEDSEGRCVRTLYATGFTATGGWENRPEAVKLWVERSRLPEMTASQVDAITGATPATGDLKYEWDLTDAEGKPVAAGAYTLFVEGSLRSEKRVLYSVPFEVGMSARDLEVGTEYFGDDCPERAMLSSVKARYTTR